MNSKIKNQIMEKSKYLEQLFKEQNELYDESEKMILELDNLRIKCVFEDGILNESIWTVSLNYNENVELCGYNKNFKKLCNNFNDISHGRYEITPNIRLDFDDNNINLIFSDIKKVGEFINKHNLKIDISNLEENQKELKEKYDSLTKILMDIKGK